MRIKKFVGQDIKTLTEQMKKELGPDAIVLNMRKMARGGMLGALGKEMIEITAAIDEEVDVGRSTYSPATHTRGGAISDDSFETLLKRSGIQVSSGTARNHASETSTIMGTPK